MQGETGWNDYGWRQYMPEIGRWNGMDQLSESYASYSPYAYVMNNPVMMFDPDGRITQNWLNGIYNMSPTGKTTYSNFSSNGMSAWATYESLPFGEASQLYNLIDRGGNGNYTYWTGGDSAYTPSFKNGEWNLYGNLGTMHQVQVTNNNDYWGILNNSSTVQSYTTNGIGTTLGTTAQISNDLVDAGKMIKTPNIFKTYNLYRSNGYLNGNRYISGTKFLRNVKIINALNDSKVVKGDWSIRIINFI